MKEKQPQEDLTVGHSNRRVGWQVELLECYKLTGKNVSFNTARRCVCDDLTEVTDFHPFNPELAGSSWLIITNHVWNFGHTSLTRRLKCEWKIEHVISWLSIYQYLFSRIYLLFHSFFIHSKIILLSICHVAGTQELEIQQQTGNSQ